VIAGLALRRWYGLRVLYAVGYQREPKQRELGFGISMTAFFAAFFGGGYGVLRALIAG
jgi:hypothetical protein